MNNGRSIAGASPGKPLFRTPSVQAVFIQLSSFLLVLALAQGMSIFSETELTLAVAALLQGALAAALSRLFGLATWWLLIQAVFPIALIALLSQQLPPAIFLVAFMVLLAMYWSTFRTQVPFYPSAPAAWEAVNSTLLPNGPVRFIDIGSGLGGLVLHLSARRPESTFTGIELAPLPWLLSWLRSRIQCSRAKFIRGDYDDVDLGSFDVVFAYLSPAAMPSLWEKARAEMQPGSLLLSYEFDIPGVEPASSSTPVDGGRALYGWLM
jgi:hypothetical protein